MKDYLITFKKDLKSIQGMRKGLIKKFESELEIIKKIIDKDETLNTMSDVEIIECLTFSSLLYSIKNIFETAIDSKNKDGKKTKINDLKEFYEHFQKFIKLFKEDYMTTQSIINAFENDKIKDPINDIEQLINNMKFSSLKIEEINQIIGMAIAFNSQYAKRNKKHNIKNIDIINQLAEYYNLDGSFKLNEDTEKYRELLEIIFLDCQLEFKIYDILDGINPNTEFSVDDLVKLLVLSNERLKNNIQSTERKETIELTTIYTIDPETRNALRELKKYYKNGNIVNLPDNLEEFYKILDKTNLNEKEKNYIISLINNEISQKRKETTHKYLTENEKEIYEKSINLLNSFVHYNEDSFALKQNIEELQTILNMLEAENEEENKQYLLEEKKIIIEQLSTICNKYIKEEEQTTNNKFIFLLDKEFTPYIYQDLNLIDQTYRKAISSLINKINPENQTQFRKVLSNETLPYTMHEINSQKAHIAFIEIIPGIYIIIGANIARTGYKELNNRLKANIKVIEQIEKTIKNQNMKNQILKENEEYAEIFVKETIPQITRKKVKK